MTPLDVHIRGIDLHVPAAFNRPIIAEKLADGSYESPEARAALHCVKKDFRVLELGAGLGFVTALCAKLTAPENVLAVEANAALVPVIEDNLARNGGAGVTVLHGAVVGKAAEGQTGRLRLSEHFLASRLDKGGKSSADVPLIGIHDLIDAHRPHVVLMDVEGAEAQLFDRPWRCPLRFCVLELHPKHYAPRTIKRIVDMMSEMSMTYDPAVSRGRVLGFRRVWEKGDAPKEADP